jgi:hypothetical protein
LYHALDPVVVVVGTNDNNESQFPGELGSAVSFQELVTNVFLE